MLIIPAQKPARHSSRTPPDSGFRSFRVFRRPPPPAISASSQSQPGLQDGRPKIPPAAFPIRIPSHPHAASSPSPSGLPSVLCLPSVAPALGHVLRRPAADNQPAVQLLPLSEIFLPKIFLPSPSPQPLKIFHQPRTLTAHLLQQLETLNLSRVCETGEAKLETRPLISASQ